MRALSILVSWSIATAGGLYWASHTKVGPVIVLLSDRHGIHLGDVAGFVIAYSWAIVVTMALLPERPRP